jgi:hypothetical protein
MNVRNERARAAGNPAEQTGIAALIRTPNQVEAVTANFEKRPPVFGDVQ